MINAFALGPWATGMNVSMVVGRRRDPEVDRPRRRQDREDAASSSGRGYRYLICGYPPFLKRLVDSADVDWSGLECFAAVGGEGMSEALRSHLERCVPSGLQLLRGERPRDQHRGEKAASRSRFAVCSQSGPTSRPRSNCPTSQRCRWCSSTTRSTTSSRRHAGGELVITVNRVGTTAPKLRYNLHDLGCSVPFRRLREALAAAGAPAVRPRGRVARSAAALPLRPLRLDACLLRSEYRSRRHRGGAACPCPSWPEHRLVRSPRRRGRGGEQDADDRRRRSAPVGRLRRTPELVRSSLLARLAEVNQDYREAARFIPAGFEPRLEFHAAGTGPFDGHDVRLKRTYVPLRLALLRRR